MHKRSAKFIAPLAVLVSAAALTVCAGLASASGTSRGGPTHIYEADTNFAGNLGTIVFTGAVTDTGIDHQAGYDNGAGNLIELSKGTFAIVVSKVGTKLGNLPLDPTTCSSDGTVEGPVTIIPGSGTGAYQGITGAFDVQVSAAYVLPRAHGACNTSATHFRGIMIVKGSGTVAR
jgi:hypothetical protein